MIEVREVLVERVLEVLEVPYVGVLDRRLLGERVTLVTTGGQQLEFVPVAEWGRTRLLPPTNPWNRIEITTSRRMK